MSDSHKARFAGHTRHTQVCDCGRVLSGNGRMTHQRACEPYLREHGYPLAGGITEGLREQLRRDRVTVPVDDMRRLRPVYASDLLPGIRRRIADAVLARRADGDRRPLAHRELLDLLAPAYEAEVAEFVASSPVPGIART